LRTGQEQRVASVNQPRGPTWRGDGSRVAFTHVTRTRTCVDLGFICPSVEEARRMLGDISRFPLVKVDDNGLAVFALGAVAPDNLISEGTIQALQWRPREDQFVFRGRGGLQTIRPGERPVPLSNDPNIGSPAWSPDGQRLVAQMRIHDRTEIVLLDAGGAVAAYLTQPPPTYERPGKPAPNNVAPAWSPDGQSLLFLSDRDGAWRLYIMQADGANQRPFLPDAVGQLQWRYDFAAERVVNWGK
jgi:Tol biopolymer transport system component